MKPLDTIAAAVLMAVLAGCATTTKITVNEPVGPCSTGQTGTPSTSALRVFSARERAPLDLNREVFCDTDMGRDNSRFEQAHSNYAIYAADGSLVKKVHNARGIYDENPAVVNLPPGHYTIRAEAELSYGEIVPVEVPVVIRSDKTATVHLEPDWQPSGQVADLAALVRASDGRIVGCRAEHPAEMAGSFHAAQINLK
jgi:hypothetical protein